METLLLRYCLNPNIIQSESCVLLTVFSGTQGLIFVIDSSDRDRIDEARQELHRIISDREMKESLLLVFANKQDIAGGKFCALATSGRSFFLSLSSLIIFRTAMTPSEVTDKLQLHKLKDRIWYTVPSCATTGEGLLDGLVSATARYLFS